eukprot:TRINITY_DN23050_c0_g1_i1.p1 TRINITY_DN23050_c0_g1~~TRINITY_DN23050_c0_g1_i1.p1  ORF type:complete len:224 (-),score=83.64 TRINITY_DN23050_c0_g1_i1:35-706(-)
MLISGEKLVMVVGGREREIDERGEILEKLNKEKIRMETCCITDVDVVVNSLPNSRLDLLETPQRSGRKESGGGKLRVTFSEEELEIHDEDNNMDDNERTDDSPARWSKLSRPPYLGWDNPFCPTGSVSQDADTIVRFWKEKKLAKMYCEILEEEETATTEEEEMDETEEKDLAKTEEDRKDEDQNAHLTRDIILYPAFNVERNKIIENKAEPEKFQTYCCSIS